MNVEAPTTEIYPSPRPLLEQKNLLTRFNSAQAEAESTQKFLEQYGARGEIIGDGKNADLERIFQQSLLGFRLKDRVEVDKAALNSYEQSLINQNARLLAIVDWDGVMGSPSHAFLRFAQNPPSWPKGLKRIKEFGRIGLKEWRWFKKTARASNHLVVWSSRRLINDELSLNRLLVKPFEGPISSWPFFDVPSLRRIALINPNKIEVWPQKPLLARKQSLRKIIKLTTTKSWEMIYYIGSSHFDRQTVRQFVA